MSLHSGLLKQARFLARKEPKKPTQASLRRSVSASYYALFHLLVDEATKLLLSGNVRRPLRDSLARAFHHSFMKQAALEFTKQQVSPKLSSGFNRQAVPQPLVDVATAFVQLQEARHDADYNRTLRFTRSEVLDLVDLAELAFQDWKLVRRTLHADTFLTGVLAYRHMQG
ncbi:MAG: hypothetical protein OXB95_06665 [Rhodobacteraceae bacterium]|nr:hypothetical protein [Paracoccaceae bacterium]